MAYTAAMPQAEAAVGAAPVQPYAPFRSLDPGAQQQCSIRTKEGGVPGFRPRRDPGGSAERALMRKIIEALRALRGRSHERQRARRNRDGKVRSRFHSQAQQEPKARLRARTGSLCSKVPAPNWINVHLVLCFLRRRGGTFLFAAISVSETSALSTGGASGALLLGPWFPGGYSG
jgi:hypothetical protein